jgi:hypothetical protein
VKFSGEDDEERELIQKLIRRMIGFFSFFLLHRSLSDALNSLPVFMIPFRTVKNEFYLFEGRLFYLQVFIL